MSRRRWISTQISKDRKLVNLSKHGHLPLLLYTWAIPHLDDWGRMTGDAMEFKLEVCPALDVSIDDIEEALNQIAEVGLWQLYGNDSMTYIAIPAKQWYENQSYINVSKRLDDSKSEFPSAPDWEVFVEYELKRQQQETAINSSKQQRVTKNSKKQQRTAVTSNEQQETAENSITPSPTPTPSLTLKDKDQNNREENEDENNINDIKSQALSEIIKAYEETFGVMRGDPHQLMSLVDYIEQGMDVALVKSVIHRSTQAKGSPVPYAQTILKNLLRNGIKTLEEELKMNGDVLGGGYKAKSKTLGNDVPESRHIGRYPKRESIPL